MTKTPKDFDDAVREFQVVVVAHLERLLGPFVRWLSDLLNRRREP